MRKPDRALSGTPRASHPTLRPKRGKIYIRINALFGAAMGPEQWNSIPLVAVLEVRADKRLYNQDTRINERTPSVFDFGASDESAGL